MSRYGPTTAVTVLNEAGTAMTTAGAQPTCCAGRYAYSTTTVAASAWHRFVLHAMVNGTSSIVDVSKDGTAVPGLALTGQDFGTNPVSKLHLGETATGRTYDVVLDDVTVSQSSL